MIRSAVLALLSLAALPVHAAVFTVTKTADTLDGACDHDCSLREAVAAANAHQLGTAVDVVVVPAGIYALTRTGAGEDSNVLGDLDVTGSLILIGAGAGSTILDGAGLDRVLDVRAQAEIFGVTIRNGRVDGDGGGLLVRPDAPTRRVLLRRSVVSGNRTQQAGDGGGIAVLTGIEVWESAVLDNHAEGDGGGIGTVGVGRFELRNVTVSGNAANRSGGGLFYREELDVIVSGSTVAFNRAGVSGGGLYSFSLFPGEYLPQVSGSIVALNTAPADPDCRSVRSAGYNVFGAGESCSPEPTDRSGTAAAPLDPKLAPLSGAFGPTPVHALLAGSPALNVVSGACEPADQVGQSRFHICDAGAWERLDDPACVPGGSVLCLQEGRFRVTASWTSGTGSQDAQAVSLTDDTGNYWFFSPDNLELMVKVLDGCAVNQHWWVFTSGLTDRGVTLRVEDLPRDRTWTYTTAPGQTYPPKLDTGAFDCAPLVPGGGTGVADEGSDAPEPPAVLVVTWTADTFDGVCDRYCSLRDAVAAANRESGTNVIVLAPGVYTLDRPGRGEENAATGDLDVRDDLVILGAGADRTVLDGGGTDRVLHLFRSLDLHDLTVRNGRAEGDFGGGILAFDRLSLVRSVVTANQADEGGGGIYAADELRVRDSTVTGNSAEEGGGIHAGFDVELENVTVSGNQAGERGGGIYFSLVVAELAHVTITGNSAPQTGGLFVVPAECQILCPSPVLQRAWTVVAGNTGGARPDCANLPLQPLGGNNVFGVGDGCGPGSSDLAGTRLNPLDPRLGPLGLHGGPTPTRVPLAGSPVLDRAPCPAGRDQRGRPRPDPGDHPLCDAGAVELLPGACQPDEDTLCLGEKDRFEVTVEWTAKGKTGSGKAVPLAEDTGALWFFEPDNLELTVKVLDGCSLNDRYWVFLSGLTDVGVEVTVRDTETGETWSHTHAAGKPFQPRLDTDALDVCP